MLGFDLDQQLPADWTTRNELGASWWQLAFGSTPNSDVNAAVLWHGILPGDDDALVKSHLFLGAVWNEHMGHALLREWTPRADFQCVEVLGSFQVTDGKPDTIGLRAVTEKGLERIWNPIGIKNFAPAIVPRRRFQKVVQNQCESIECREFDRVYREPKRPGAAVVSLLAPVPVETVGLSDS